MYSICTALSLNVTKLLYGICGFTECASNVIGTITLLGNLGFVLHPKKSVFIPTQILVFLGFFF